VGKWSCPFRQLVVPHCWGTRLGVWCKWSCLFRQLVVPHCWGTRLGVWCKWSCPFRQLVVPHRWGTRLGVWTRTPAQADPLARGKPVMDVALPLLSRGAHSCGYSVPGRDSPVPTDAGGACVRPAPPAPPRCPGRRASPPRTAARRARRCPAWRHPNQPHLLCEETNPGWRHLTGMHSYAEGQQGGCGVAAKRNRWGDYDLAGWVGVRTGSFSHVPLPSWVHTYASGG
jgi:hypothetical protein